MLYNFQSYYVVVVHLIQRFGVTCFIAGQRYTKECGTVADIAT